LRDKEQDKEHPHVVGKGR